MLSRARRPCVVQRSLLRGLMLAALIACQAKSAEAQFCGTWETHSTPNPGNSVNRLTSVDAVSANDAWAVGLWRHEPSGTGPLVIRWDGAAWREINTPDVSSIGTNPQVAGVAAAPGGDVWVVGYVTTTYPTNNMPLVLRWRGGSWEEAETVAMRPQREYPYGPRGGFLEDIDALSDDDIWAVGIGAGYGDATSASVPLAAHWDGSSWTDVEVPLVANRHHELDAVEMIAHDDVWAVGDYRNISGTFRGVTYHWDGNSWSYVHNPIEDIHQSHVSDIEAFGPDDVWALGGADAAGPLIMHWDGTSWSMMPAPPNVGASLAVLGPNDVWVSGWNGYWHWDGSGWTEAPVTIPSATYVIRGGGMAVVGACDLWSVGFWTLADGITSTALTERLMPTVAASVATGAGAIGEPAFAFASPFVAGGEIRFTEPVVAGSTLRVYDVQGRVVRTLLDGAGAGERRSASWDGRDDHARRVPAGLYFLRLEAGGRRQMAKLLLAGHGE